MKNANRTLRAALVAASLALALAFGMAASASQGPDAAVTSVARGLANNQPQVAWHALPGSYQSDLTGIVHGFAQTVDQEVWDNSWAVANKAARVLRDKKQFILENPMVSAKINSYPEAEQAYDDAVELFSILTESELGSLDMVRAMNLESFLSGTGSRLMQQAQVLSMLHSGSHEFQDLRDIVSSTSVEHVRNEGDVAVLAITPEGKETREVRFVQVEGKWVPQDMAREWPEAMSRAQSRLDQLPVDRVLENKESMLAALDMADQALDQMLAAQNSYEFDMALQTLFGVAIMQSMAFQGQSGN